MATKKELEAENERLKRELGSQVSSEQAAVDSAQVAMNASKEYGDVSRMETRSSGQVRRAAQHEAISIIPAEVEEGEVKETVVVQYDTQG